MLGRLGMLVIVVVLAGCDHHQDEGCERCPCVDHAWCYGDLVCIHDQCFHPYSPDAGYQDDVSVHEDVGSDAPPDATYKDGLADATPD